MLAPEPANVPEKLFYALFSLQHRGQEGAGVCFEEGGRLVVEKNSGMVSQVLSRFLREEHRSTIGIGHVRYSTAGGSSAINAQPLLVRCNKGEIALAHNGNISNSESLRAELSAAGAIFQTSSDSELILHMISRAKAESPVDILKEVLPRLEGAYSLLMIWNGTLYAIRDPKGFRPLYAGLSMGARYAASETCALTLLGVDDPREVEPGEILEFGAGGFESHRFAPRGRMAKCVFELIYFARPDSGVFGVPVHEMRKRFGAALAESDDVAADLVVPVPDSGSSAAIGYAARAGIPFDLGLTRNHYAGRSFIMPTTAQRELVVKMKLQATPGTVEGKRVVLIDDSLVRGTTSKILVRLLKEAGAREVHLRLCSPEIHSPCFYGIDIPTKAELISNKMSPAAIAEFIGADSVRFLDISLLKRCLVDPEDYCYACFSGEYPCPLRAEG